jgi:hypothetical protein
LYHKPEGGKHKLDLNYDPSPLLAALAHQTRQAMLVLHAAPFRLFK